MPEKYNRAWKPVGSTVRSMEIQRLSRLAIKERLKNPNRFRIVKDGRVLGSYVTKSDVEKALQDRNAETYNQELYDAFAKNPPDSPVTQTQTGAVTPRGAPVSPVAGSPDDDIPRDDIPLVTPAPAAFVRDVQKDKAQLSPEDLNKRRKSLWKPQEAGQEPTGDWEKAVAWHYNEDSRTWKHSEMFVKVATKSFAAGVMREAFKMQGKKSKSGPEAMYVAKLFNDHVETELIKANVDTHQGNLNEVYSKQKALRLLENQVNADFMIQLAEKIWPDEKMMTLRDILGWHVRVKLIQSDAEMQGYCKIWATAYNELKPPKQVTFCDVFLVVLTDRPDQPIYSCEPFISGDYKKHSDNAGGIDDNQRNTPQAFSHFTHKESKGSIIIVDIQGVGDTYTDPQVHSLDGGYGIGNTGQEGMDAFFKTHQCNDICVGLGLAEAGKAPAKKDPNKTVFRRT